VHELTGTEINADVTSARVGIEEQEVPCPRLGQRDRGRREALLRARAWHVDPLRGVGKVHQAAAVEAAGVRAAHQFLTFTTASPLQHGAAAALAAPDSYYVELAAAYRARRDLLAGGLADLGFEVFLPAGTYSMLADHTRFGFTDDVAFVRHLIEATGVAAIPPSAFYHRRDDGSSLVRFAFCKDEATLATAIDRLGALPDLALDGLVSRDDLTHARFDLL